MPLWSCPGCQRHVRVSDATCPFCRTALPAMGGLPGLTPLVLLGGAIVLTTGCAFLGAAPMYGIPAPRPSASPSATPPAPQPLYGAMAPSPTPTPPAVQPLYGAMPPSQ